MLTTLDAIVRRLADAYEPDRVMLFGSRARGSAPDDADFDLLVVKDTSRRPLDRPSMSSQQSLDILVQRHGGSHERIMMPD